MRHHQQPRVAVVTGASGGVGRATVRRPARSGMRIALLARGSTGLTAAADEVRAAGGVALPIEADVADYRQVEAAAARATAELGPIDLWVNNAFTTVFAPFTEITPQEYRRATESLRCDLLHSGTRVRATMVHLPGLNTPQFDWVLSRLRRHPWPVASVYQPEVAARAIAQAARRPGRREYWIGGMTAATIIGNRIIPAVLDRYLARTGFSSQQTGEPISRSRPANLWRPADSPAGGDFGAHGSFDNESHRHSAQQWLSEHRRAVAAGTLIAGVAALATKAVHRHR